MHFLSDKSTPNASTTMRTGVVQLTFSEHCFVAQLPYKSERAKLMGGRSEPFARVMLT